MKFPQLLVLGLSMLVAVLAQSTADSTTNCTFSCPVVDNQSRPLVQRPRIIGFNSHYSIFECLYYSRIERLPLDRKCSYYKDTGLKALGAADDDCPSSAVPCPEGNSLSEADLEGQPSGKPMFSNIEKEEIPAWVEGGRYLLYLKEHNRRAE